MIALSVPLPDATLASRLEEAFCESVRSSWSFYCIPEHGVYELQGYFESQEAADAAWREVQEEFSELAGLQPARKILDDQDWQTAYRAYLKPWSHAGLNWVPEWERPTWNTPEGEVTVFFDAGMAFGTGSHETTRLCAIRMLDYRRQCEPGALAGKSLIDAGCGSGILAVTGCLLGFGSVFGFDQDPEAIRVSCENLTFNGLSPDRAFFLHAGIEEALKDRQADILVANIQADVLSIHAEGLLEAVKPGGTLVLSGILVRERDRVRDHFMALANRIYDGKFCSDSREMGEWADLCFFRA